MSGIVCRAASIALTGLQGTTVMVESAISQQLPGIAIIGLPDASLAEAKLRVRTATSQAGMPLSDRFITNKWKSRSVESAHKFSAPSQQGDAGNPLTQSFCSRRGGSRRLRVDVRFCA